MNLICNTCLGARLYQINKIQYSNPFMWNIIEADSMIYLVENFNSLNFANITILRSDYIAHSNKWLRQFSASKQKVPTIFKVVIENAVEVNYLHYRFDINYITPAVKDIDVYYGKIWEYVAQKYIDRTKRMIAACETPMFVISTAEESYSVEKQRYLIDAINRTPYRMCIISSDLPGGMNGNALVIHANIKSMDNTIQQAKTFNQQILAFQS